MQQVGLGRRFRVTKINDNRTWLYFSMIVSRLGRNLNNSRWWLVQEGLYNRGLRDYFSLLNNLVGCAKSMGKGGGGMLTDGIACCSWVDCCCCLVICCCC